jgi:hypothetical protein
MSLARLVVTAVRVEGRTKAEVSRDYGVSPRWVYELVRPLRRRGGVRARAEIAPAPPQPSADAGGARRCGLIAWATQPRRGDRELQRLWSDGYLTAEKQFRVAIELFSLAEQRVEVAVTYRGLGDLLGSRGEADASCESYRAGILALEENL